MTSSAELDTPALIKALEEARAEFPAWIDYVRFPYYRSLVPGTRIDFDFPFTVLVGKNGTGKSSTLQALYGCPEGKSVGEHWFATKVDRVEDRHEDLEQSLVYGFRNDGNLLEVLKLRRNRKGNPDYWEAEGPLAKYGMDPKGERSRPLTKPVVYLDFRVEISAFAKWFYFPDERKLAELDKRMKARAKAARAKQPPARPERARRYSKQDYIRARAPILRKLVDGDLVPPAPSGKSKTVTPLDTAAIRTLNAILDKHYDGGLLVEHGIYGNQWGKTVVFRTHDTIGKEYSEAFAGSGEVALAILVHEIGKLPPNSLVLLDEPEVSLHPTAQDRVKRYLLRQCLVNKLQIIVSTHSPRFVKGLPPSAIKVFIGETDGRVTVRAGYTPEEAFQEIGGGWEPRTVLVEDERAEILLTAGLKQATAHTEHTMSVQVVAGGVAEIYRNIGVYCREPAAPAVVLDGDQEPAQRVDPGALPARASLSDLQRTIAEQTKGNNKAGPSLRWAGADKPEQGEHARAYLKFLHSRVFYLPGATPEQAVWDDTRARDVLERYGKFSEDFWLSVREELDYKRRLQLLAERVGGAVTADTIYREFVTHFAQGDRLSAGPLSRLVDTLRAL